MYIYDYVCVSICIYLHTHVCVCMCMYANVYLSVSLSTDLMAGTRRDRRSMLAHDAANSGLVEGQRQPDSHRGLARLLAPRAGKAHVTLVSLRLM